MTKELRRHLPGHLADNIITFSMILFIVAMTFFAVKLWDLANEQHALVRSNALQIAQLKQIARDSCRSRHQLATIDVRAYTASLIQSKTLLQSKELGPKTTNAVRDALGFESRQLARARAADCVVDGHGEPKHRQPPPKKEHSTP